MVYYKSNMGFKKKKEPVVIHIPLGTIPVVLSVLLDFSVVPSPARIEPETLRSQDEFFRARDEKLAFGNLTVSGWWFSNHLEKIEFVNGFGIIPYITWKNKNGWNHQPGLLLNIAIESSLIYPTWWFSSSLCKRLPEGTL